MNERFHIFGILFLGVVSQITLANYLLNAKYYLNIGNATRGDNKRNRGHHLTAEAQKCFWEGWEVLKDEVLIVLPVKRRCSFLTFLEKRGNFFLKIIIFQFNVNDDTSSIAYFFWGLLFYSYIDHSLISFNITLLK